MIPFKFEYYQPETAQEAVQTFQDLDARGLQPKYFSGGTEIISMSRVGNLSFGVLIDIKHIPECTQFTSNDKDLVLGSALTLSNVADADVFHLLTLAARRIADHTAQYKITLGGNAAGTVIYHEAALPLLLAGSTAALTGPEGGREVALSELFQRRLNLKKGELLTHFIVPAEAAGLPCVHAKHTEGEKIGYPLLTVMALRRDREIAMAFAGIQPYPVAVRANAEYSGAPDAEADGVMKGIPQPLLNDSLGTHQYREHVLRRVIAETLERLGGEKA